MDSDKTSCVQGPRNSSCGYEYLKANSALIRTRNSDGGRRPPIFIPDLPIRAILSSSPPLRLRQAPPGLGRNCWRLLRDRIVEGRSTEIEHGLRRPVTLHQAGDGIHSFCHEIVPEFNGLSPSECLVIREIYERGDLYLKQSRSFIGFLGLCWTQRLITSSRRP